LRRLRLPETARARLKTPLGELIQGPPENSITRLKQILKSEKISKIICVGDFVSRLLVESSVPVDLAIVDNKMMREDAETFQSDCEYVFRVVNPAGTLEMAAWAAVREALEKPRSVLVVDGEEDLLALAAIALAPHNSLVLYGQPREGMIAVRTDEAKKLEIESIIAQMIRE
jgi:uncharacterized protein (UPF0218 family)